MDLSSFSNSDFDACAWINSQLEEVPHGETTETHLSSLAMKLHLASSEYAEQLETAMVESMSSMPRMVAEVSRLEDQLQVIHHEMRKLSEHINAVDKRSIAGVEELSRLDGLKASMEVCRSTLEEHARWSQLVREARQLLENGGTLSETADRIETMFRSLDVLREMPGHAERQDACVSYRSSLLAALLPSIRSQLTSSTAEEVEGTGGSLREYLYVFRKLGREEQFEGEYLSCRPAPLLHTWASTTEGVQQHKQSLSAALAHFLGSVSSFLADEEAAAAALFGTTRSRRLLTQLLAAALQPMRGEMAELLRQADDVAVIAECSGVLDEFCKRLLGRAPLGSRDRGSDREVREAVLSGCWAAQAQYVDCEDRHLRGVMATAMASVRFRCAASALDDEEVDEEVLAADEGDPVELLSGFADALLPALDGVFREVTAGLCRCCQFMAGAALKAHCRALAAALQHLSKLLTMKMECLAQACGISSGSSSADMSSASSSGDEARTAASIAARLQAVDCDKAGVMACALRALQAAGRYKRHLADVEAQLKACCAAVLTALLQAEDEEENEEVASADAPSAAYCAQLLRADGNLLAETKAFLSQGSSMAAALAAFPRKQATQAGQALLALCVDPLSRQLDGYRCSSSEDVIINTGIEEEEEEVSVLQERLLPQAVVTMIGETMLSWVQDLDAFASSDALVDLLVLRGEASALCPSSCGWRALASKLDLKDDKALAQLASKALAAKGLQAYEREVLQTARAQGITAWASASVGDDSSAEDDPGSGTAGHTGFVNEWLAVIADSIVGIFLAHLLDMRDAPLSVGARAQLMVDADYLRNVMSATGLRCHPLLLRAFQLAKESPESTGKLLRSLSAGKSLGSLRDLLALDLALAAAIHGTLVN